MLPLRALPLLLALPLPGSGAETVQHLLDDLDRWSRRPAQTEARRLEEGEDLLRRVDRVWSQDHPRGDDLLVECLDFLGRCQRLERERPLLAPPPSPSASLVTEAELHDRLLRMLRRRLPSVERQLTHEVLTGLVKARPHPLERRTAACAVLAASPTATLALLSCTRPAPPETEVPPALLEAATAALAGRNSSGVHLRLIRLLNSGPQRAEDRYKALIERHFRSLKLTPNMSRSAEAVRAFVEPALASESWREASLGVAVARCLPPEDALPLLIDSLEEWLGREDDPQRPVRRLQGELLSELERRTGMRCGRHPGRWRTFLEAWRRGDAPLAGEPGERPRTTSEGFFGLRPATDRVLFVLDRSGSMEARFGDARGPSRLEEATNQLRRLVEQLGPRARFGVVTFADRASRWREKLAPATEENLRSATRFVLRGGAEGGTRLLQGMRLALHADGSGRPDLERLEADTVIVLCDGGTAEGPGWVEPFLLGANGEARVLFHAVQLGQGGDGTLRALAEGSGGEFLEVEG